MTYAEMIALPDSYGASDLENDENDGSTDENATPTPRPSLIKRQPSSSASTVHNININYRHTYSVAKKNGDEVDIPTFHCVAAAQSGNAKVKHSGVDHPTVVGQGRRE